MGCWSFLRSFLPWMLRWKVERLLIYAFRRLRRLLAEFLSNDNMPPLLSLAMVASPRSATIPSIFFLQDGGSSRTTVRDTTPATPQVAGSPVAARVPGLQGRMDAVEKTRD
jgi:hypothetical protein